MSVGAGHLHLSGGTHRCQWTMSYLLDLDLQVLVSCLGQVLETELNKLQHIEMNWESFEAAGSG